MHGPLSAKIAVAVGALALVIVGAACTAGTDTQYVNAGFQDPTPADPLQDGLSGTPQSGDPPPIVQGLTVPPTTQQGQDQGDTAAAGSNHKDGG